MGIPYPRGGQLALLDFVWVRSRPNGRKESHVVNIETTYNLAICYLLSRKTFPKIKNVCTNCHF